MRIFFRLCSTPLIRSNKNKASVIRPTTFVDELKVRVTGGTGGSGCIAFTKLFAKEFAGPDGGDGGNGGHVIFQATKDVKSLAGIPPVIKAEDGVAGSAMNCTGKNAEPTIVKVPEGTLIRNLVDNTLIVDLIDASFLAARGGAGGRGNKFFATSLNQSPKIAEQGSPGETLEYVLEMATIAHVGLVGFPNAGKSTLLSALTRARPKVASYPFTTLRVNVGIIPFDDYSQIIVADIPGLIQGAWQNRGLGHGFLRHIQRCVCLIYIVDMTNNPQEQYEILKNELKMYDPSLLNKPSLLIGNKIDLDEAKENAEIVKTNLNISGKYGVNLKQLIILIRKYYEEQRAKTPNIMPITT